MAELYGIDCLSENCFHDTITGYRLRFQIRRGRECPLCKRTGDILPDLQAPGNVVIRNRLRCLHCTDPISKQPIAWNRNFVRERKDMMFRKGELIAARSQMQLLGCKDQLDPNTRHLIENHRSLPPGYDARALTLMEEAMPRCGVYFRWNPEAGQILSPDLVFQKNFPPNATAEERRTAPERQLTVDQFRELTQYCLARNGEGEFTTSYSSIPCQHCHRPMPVKSFSTQSLRSVSPGD